MGRRDHLDLANGQLQVLGDFEMMEMIVLASVFSAVVLTVVGAAGLMNRDPALKRMSVSGQPSYQEKSIFYERRSSRLQRLVAPIQKQLSQPETVKGKLVKNRLIQAGFYHPSSVEIYYTVRIIAALGLSGAAAVLTFFFLPVLGASSSMLFMIGGGLIGYFAPVVWLASRISQRQRAFRLGMPDAMDMILVGVEAGLSLPASIKHLCEEFSDAHPIISEQFRIVTLEFQAGRSRPEALASLARRMDVQEARTFSTMISQSETLGTSLATTLRVLAEEMRRDRMLKAETRAAELPVKMAIPLVLCIFPALFSVIMSPLVIRLIRTFTL